MAMCELFRLGKPESVGSSRWPKCHPMGGP